MRTKASPAERALRMAGMTTEVAGSYLGYLAQGLFLDKNARTAKLAATHGRAARRMSAEMLSLRGPAMKLGQTLSLQQGILPEDILAELSKLQRQAPGMHPSLMRAQFKAELGADPEELFRSFDPEPFAAASLGQVHRAVTRGGDVVAVKIQYPDIRQAIQNDFKWFRALSGPARLSRHLPGHAIDELETQFLAETDYVREAANIDLLRHGLKPLAKVVLPSVHRKFSTGRVLTMSIVPGVHLDEFLQRKPSRSLRDEVGSRLFELYYFQVLRLGTFHADPHWGNYLFGRNGEVGLVDFGCVKYLQPEFVTDLKNIYLYPGKRDSDEFRRLLQKRYALFGTRLPAATQRALVSFAENFYRKVYPPEPEKADSAFDFGDGSFLQEYMRESAKLMKSRGVLSEHLFLARAEIGLYQTLLRLRARVRTSQLVRKYLYH
jgi:predicted unusual protein kinase regulating ubiquinone biosynthesis (AarF/ABC1/UbiB family)